MYWFQLWREYKLSIAELLKIFSNWEVVFFDKNFLILGNLSEENILEKSNRLWWTIKIVKLELVSDYEEIFSRIVSIWEESNSKFKYSLSIFPEDKNLKDTLKKLKKRLKEHSISSRYVNKNDKNVSSAQVLWEKLVEQATDFNLINADKLYFWYSIWVQDINSYSERDYSKSRDMQVGMLPPKLSQIMINLSWWNTVYDPFVWLWTILIESIYMWNRVVYWSDLSDSMITASKDNLSKLKNKFNFEYQISKLNAKFINESDILLESDVIVSEWYLWEVMTQKNITIDRINKQKQTLLKLYDSFFTWLIESNFRWNIVISFPFWEIKWKYIYFEELYELLAKYCTIHDILPNTIELKPTKSWSLLYKRPNQLVWREIFILTMK